MEDSRDPRIQIYANLDNVQNDVENAADSRKVQIKKEAEGDINDIKGQMKDLKQVADDHFKEYKERKKNSDDPRADEKISAAKDITKAIKKEIEVDYEDTKDRIEKDRDHRLDSIDNMLNESDEE